MRFSVQELIGIACRYHPRLGDRIFRLPADEFDALRQGSPEWQALWALKQQRQRDDAAWREFLGVLRQAMPDARVYRIPVPGHDVCYTASAYLGTAPWPAAPGGPLHRHLEVCLSFLAPVYLVYEAFSLEHGAGDQMAETPLCCYVPSSDSAAPMVATIERELVARFECDRMDLRHAGVVLHGIHVDGARPGNATILDALFGSGRLELDTIIHNPPLALASALPSFEG